MNKSCPFPLLCLLLLFVACRPYRQAATVVEVSPKSEIKFEHTITLPETVGETIINIPKDIPGPVFVELEDTWLELTRLQTENDSLLQLKARIGRKRVQLTDTVTIEFETFTVRRPGVDSVFTIVDGDTAFQYAYANGWKLPTLVADVKEAAKGERIPWEAFVVLMVGLVAYYAKKGKKR